jgi:hypothetical protein
MSPSVVVAVAATRVLALLRACLLANLGISVGGAVRMSKSSARGTVRGKESDSIRLPRVAESLIQERQMRV